MFPQSWIDLVVVLRTDSTLLYDRLASRYVRYGTTEISVSLTSFYRDYPEHKLQENLDSEIMQVLLEEARESYDAEIVVELRSDGTKDIESNVERIEMWIKSWEHDNSDSAK